MEISHTHWNWFWMVPVLLMILMCVVGSRLCRRACNRGDNPDGHRGWLPCGCLGRRQDTIQTPDQILDKRYASGEFLKEQYGQMKREFE